MVLPGTAKTMDQFGFDDNPGVKYTFCPPKAWAEALWPNLFYWNELDKGGHFAAFEQPALFTEELRKAFRSRRA